jgi:hypothetical protein
MADNNTLTELIRSVAAEAVTPVFQHSIMIEGTMNMAFTVLIEALDRRGALPAREVAEALEEIVSQSEAHPGGIDPASQLRHLAAAARALADQPSPPEDAERRRRAFRLLDGGAPPRDP